jgi:hypothetical protein
LFEGKSMVMAARNTSLFKDDDMPKSSSLVSNSGGRVNFVVVSVEAVVFVVDEVTRGVIILVRPIILSLTVG